MVFLHRHYEGRTPAYEIILATRDGTIRTRKLTEMSSEARDPAARRAACRTRSLRRIGRRADACAACGRGGSLRASLARAPESVGQNARVQATPLCSHRHRTSAFRDARAVLIWQASCTCRPENYSFEETAVGTSAIPDVRHDYLAVRRIPDRGECFDQTMREVVKLRKYE